MAAPQPAAPSRFVYAPHPVTPETRRERFKRYGLVALPFVVVFGVLAAVGWQRCGLSGCPDVEKLNAYRPGGAPAVLDRRGRQVGELSPVSGDLVPLKALPKYVPEAFVAGEDRRFREHGGVDWPRVAGAFLANLRSRRIEEGFSTITMQLARNVFPDRLPGQERTLSRKVLEVRVAREIEERFSKDEILELYLNHIYFGRGARGIEAAAQEYFGISARRLSLAQAALLAALPRGPSLYDPRRHAERAKERRDLVLKLMAEQEKVSPAEAEAAKKQPLGVTRRSGARAGVEEAAYFMEEVRRELEERFGDGLYDQRLKIHTTLDLGFQHAAEKALRAQLGQVESGRWGKVGAPGYAASGKGDQEGTDYLQGAFVALDAKTGDVLAWVGGRNFEDSRFDRVRGARRQSGSAFKPFVYAAALRAGRSLADTVSDQPLRVELSRGHSWEPRNFDGVFEPAVTLREALVRSKNVATVRLGGEVGLARVAELAESLGIEPPIPQEPALPLGTVAVSPIELARAYTAFATLGTLVEPRLITRVDDEAGVPLWDAGEPTRRQVLDPVTAYLVTDVLREALLRGTGTGARSGGYGGPAAGKTGTTNDGTDAWFVGYTPDMVAAVWMGYDQPRTITRQATGGRLAAPVWGVAAAAFYRGGGTPAPWARPAGIEEALVDPATGYVLSSGCQLLAGAPRRELFVAGRMPPATCPFDPATMDPALLAQAQAGLADPSQLTLPSPAPAGEEGDDEAVVEEVSPPSESAPIGYAPSQPRPAPSARPSARPGLTPPAGEKPREAAPPVKEPDPSEEQDEGAGEEPESEEERPPR